MGCGCSKKRSQKISSANTKTTNVNNTKTSSEKRSQDRKRRMVSIKAVTNSTFSKK